MALELCRTALDSSDTLLPHHCPPSTLAHFPFLHRALSLPTLFVAGCFSPSWSLLKCHLLSAAFPNHSMEINLHVAIYLHLHPSSSCVFFRALTKTCSALEGLSACWMSPSQNCKQYRGRKVLWCSQLWFQEHTEVQRKYCPEDENWASAPATWLCVCS